MAGYNPITWVKWFIAAEDEPDLRCDNPDCREPCGDTVFYDGDRDKVYDCMPCATDERSALFDSGKAPYGGIDMIPQETVLELRRQNKGRKPDTLDDRLDS